MKLYTRRGDDGKTSLLGTKTRVSKASARISACGDVDELNSFIGLLRSEDGEDRFGEMLSGIQRDLFRIGAELAAVRGSEGDVESGQIRKDDYEKLERYIDSVEEELTPLKNFILPGGSRLASLFHVARTVCRRAERSLAALLEREEVNNNILIYLNRLSDLMFALSRLANKRADVKEVKWEGS